VSSFVGAFPMDAPRYVILVIVDEPKTASGRSSGNAVTGGAVAAPPVGRIVRQIAPLLGLPPVSAEELQAIEGPKTGFPLFASTIPVSATVQERPRAAQ
jgi:cell division protein FtsI (penicillin-binding protein 3)